MRVVMFYHSLVSDWNHGNAHFLRGVAGGAACARGHEVSVFEPRGWLEPRRIWCASTARRRSTAFERAYPDLHEHSYDARDAGSGPGAGRRRPGARARVERPRPGRSASASIAAGTARLPAAVPRYAPSLRHRPREHGAPTISRLRRRAGVRRGDSRDLPASAAGRSASGPGTRPRTRASSGRSRGRRARRAIWSGSATGATRSARAELHEFLFEPVRALGLRRAVYGVRYPRAALDGARRGRHRVRRLAAELSTCPQRLRRYRVTVHVPRRPYVDGAARDPDHPCRSRRWPAASRWSRRRGTTPKACSRRARITWSRATARR